MPITPSQAPKIAPLGGVETALAERTGAWRTRGPSRKIRSPDHWLSKSLKNEVPSLANAVKRAIDSGKAVSLHSSETFQIFEKLNSGKSLTPQELGSVWATVTEALGEGNIGGITDQESIFFIKDGNEQTRAEGNLKKLQQRIEKHLTGGRIRTEASVFAPRQDYGQLRDKFAHERFGVTDWSALTDIKDKREVRVLALEETVRMQGSRRVEGLLNTIGSVDNRLVDEALKSQSPQEKHLAGMAKNIQATREKILRERPRIAGMTNTDEFLLFLGIDPTDPNQAGILTKEDVVSGVVQYFGLSATEATNLQGNPDQALNYLKRSATDLCIFTGRLYEGRLQRYALERKPTTPDVLKKSHVELSEDGKKALDGKDAVSFLLQQNGVSEMTDPVGLLMTKLGIEKPQAEQFLQQGYDASWLVNSSGNKPNFGEPVHVDMGKFITWAEGDYETWALAVKRGFIDEATIRTQLDTLLTNTHPNNTARTAEIDRRMDEFKKYQAALDQTKPRGEQIEATGRWSKKRLALLAIASPVLLTMFSGNLDSEDQKELASYLA